MTTILDVSRRVGVSKSTVSKVLNGTGRVSEATKKAVFEAVKELDYRPNVLARSLSMKTTDTIGLIIPDAYGSAQYINNLIDMTQRLANDSGKFLMISQVDGNDIESSIQSIRKLVDRRCDGIIYYKSSRIEGSDIGDKLESLIDELPIPLVVLNHHLTNKPDHCVWFDQVTTARLAVDCLIDNGHRDIAYIAGRYQLLTSRLRLQGYQESLKSAGIDLNPLLIAEALDCRHQGGYDACISLIERDIPFSAVCCFSDAVAIGAIKALREKGIAVPEHVSVFGLDNDDVSSFIDPPLSTIAMPVDEIINTAGRMLLNLMNNETPPTLKESLTGELIVRQSTQSLI
ncbi:LacI family DNA-binding transcriptional regulator [Vibrio hepatarius]|uniref:LacI family DNA-binding transcriptional regulator n=1 Tax=Vibrio hepatarius TaxID=171383 RepID=UPI00148E4948|nr:LacI family DNA-binding transcriptional regulator [Vibrio hepatarius]NOI15502.1 LacI family transcriptional regulator [Vibrio hepatarius]